MSLRYRSRLIEDIEAEGVEQEDVHELLGFLVRTLGEIAPTLAGGAEFDLGDCARMRQRGLDDFVFSLWADHTGETPKWKGEFVSGTRRLRATVSLQD